MPFDDDAAAQPVNQILLAAGMYAGAYPGEPELQAWNQMGWQGPPAMKTDRLDGELPPGSMYVGGYSPDDNADLGGSLFSSSPQHYASAASTAIPAAIMQQYIKDGMPPPVLGGFIPPPDMTMAHQSTGEVDEMVEEAQGVDFYGGGPKGEHTDGPVPDSPEGERDGAQETGAGKLAGEAAAVSIKTVAETQQKSKKQSYANMAKARSPDTISTTTGSGEVAGTDPAIAASVMAAMQSDPTLAVANVASKVVPGRVFSPAPLPLATYTCVMRVRMQSAKPKSDA